MLYYGHYLELLAHGDNKKQTAFIWFSRFKSSTDNAPLPRSTWELPLPPAYPPSSPPSHQLIVLALDLPCKTFVKLTYFPKSRFSHL